MAPVGQTNLRMENLAGQAIKPEPLFLTADEAIGLHGDPPLCQHE